MTVEDPFAAPTPHMSNHASADSFRTRLILVEPLGVERDVPKQAMNPNGPKGDKITANVTTVDDLGPVQVYSQRVATGRFLDGPLYRKVWFNQDQIVEGLQTLDGQLRKMVLLRIDTLKPGTMAGQGNPWIVHAPTDADKQMARDFLAGRTVAQAAAPEENPFAPKAPF